VYNAKLKPIACPWAVASAQLVIGLGYALPMWALGLRKLPNLAFSDTMQLMPIAVLNALGHAATVLAMFEVGGGSFTHVIKASEPVVSVLLVLLISGVIPKPLTCLTLVVITYGVAYAATLGDLSVDKMRLELTTFTSLAAMTGNVCFALRSIPRKAVWTVCETHSTPDRSPT
jgi:solute carrier family 35, member E1